MSTTKNRMNKAKARWDYMEEAIRKRIASEVCISALLGWWRGKEVHDDADDAVLIEDSGSDDEELVSTPKQPKRCTSTIKVLGLTAFLFALITTLQTFAALISNSQALLIDAGSMGVDSVTYILNIFVECGKGTKWHRIAELVVGFISLSVLIILTLDVTLETLPTILHPKHQCTDLPLGSNTTVANPFDCTSSADDEVNGWIVMAFAIFGIVFDLICLHAFSRNHRQTQAGKDMNIWTALMHVGADLLRSITTFISSMLMLVFKADSAVIDAWATMIISLTILIGGLSGLVAWGRKFCICLCLPKCGFDYDDDESDEDK